jgi:bactofilin
MKLAVSLDTRDAHSAMAALDDERLVRCYHCGADICVETGARFCCCQSCGVRVNTEDILVRAMYWGENLRTAGVVVIHRHARVVCSEIVASLGVRVLGRVEADICSGGVVVVESGAELHGSVRAERLIVEPGATLSGGLVCGPGELEVQERTEMNRGNRRACCALGSY